jgi:adenylosuccinate synthase
VLGGLKELKICTGYKVSGQLLPYYRTDVATLENVEPVYETLPGWNEDVSTVRTYADLPAAAKNYVQRLEQLIGVPITMISVGPDRNATLMR